MKFKGLSIPMDIPLFVQTIYNIHQYRKKLKRNSLEEIFNDLKTRDGEQKIVGLDANLSRLKKMYRIVSWYYLKILHEDKPCFVRSLIIYDKASMMNMKVDLVIGFQKTDKIIGHSWIMLDDEVFMDAVDFVNKYNVIIKK